MISSVTSLAYKDLFEVDKSSPELRNKKSERFHSAVAKLLFNMKGARPDLETAISFLMKWLSKSINQDREIWNNVW